MDRKPASGIYMIRDAVSGRRYIGSAVRLWNRRRQHFQSLARLGIHRMSANAIIAGRSYTWVE